MLNLIAKVLVAPIVFALSLAGYNFTTPQPNYSLEIQHLQQQVSELSSSQSQNLGASNVSPQNVAFFQTSLQSGISSSATSMTLTSATYNNGASTLASSTYGFVIDEGTSVQEMVQADCTATVCTNMTRGIDFLTGTSSVSSLKFAHRRGASIKITDAPNILITGNIINGSENFPVPVHYASSVATSTLASNRNNLASAGLVADTAFSGAGVINATANANGVVQLATTLQTASSTATGSSGASLVIPSSNSTSTYNSATAALRVVVTQNNGKIDPNFVSTSSLFSNVTLTGTTTLATSTIIGAFGAYSGIGKNMAVFTTVGTTTWSVPSGITKAWVRLCGAGAGGSSSAAATTIGAGGGAAGCAEKMVDLTGTSSVQIFIGTGGIAGAGGNGGNGTWTTFGTNGFYFYGNGGLGGIAGGPGGTGNTAVGGDINFRGGDGDSSFAATGLSSSGIRANGGVSFAGGGNEAYGSGGGGGVNGNGIAGIQGFLTIIW